MRFLLDTHYAIELADRNAIGLNEPDLLDWAQEHGQLIISIATLWEVAIKSRLGKLPLRLGVEIWPQMFAVLEIPLLPIIDKHILADIGPEPGTRDPFDRLLLGVASAESCRLLTKDLKLADHPLAWRDIPLKNK